MIAVRLLVAAVTVALTSGGCGGTDGEPGNGGAADLILTNGRVYTFAWPDPDAEGKPDPAAPFDGGLWEPDAAAVAIRAGKIAAVGTVEEVMALSGAATQILDMGGRTVLPGVVESHAHVSELGERRKHVDLRGAATELEAIELVERRAAELPAGDWVVGSGWDEGAWADRMPTKELLSRRVPDHPVVLKGLHGFAVWGNELAFELAGITASTAPPVGGEIRLDTAGDPDGILLNNATDLLMDSIPEPGLEAKKRALLVGLEELARSGYVAVHNAGTRLDYMPAYLALDAERALPIRVEAMLAADADNQSLLDEWLERGPTVDRAAMLQVRSVKAYYDGALGSRGARLLEDYSDAPGHRGVSGSEYGYDAAVVAAMMDAGFQVAVHAIGDAGNRDVLDFFEGVFAAVPAARALRHRVEHAQIVHPDDFARFRDLNLVASMEPSHAVEDSPWAEARVGPERILGAYAWRTMRRHGVALTFNSDLTGTDHDLFYGLHSAVTRQNRAGLPLGGWHPEQRVTPEEALRAFTTWTAYAVGLEAMTGTLEVGKWADLTVVDIDPLNVGTEDPAGLLDGHAVMTIVDGRVVFSDL